MGWSIQLFVAIAIAGQLGVQAACPALAVNFFPPGTTNSPIGWTRQAQQSIGNDDTGSLNTIILTPTPIPKLFVQPEHPFFTKKACIPADCLPASAGHKLRLLLSESAAALPAPVSHSTTDSANSASSADNSGSRNTSSGRGSSSSSSSRSSSSRSSSTPSGHSSGVEPGSGDDNGSERVLATCLTTVAVPAAYDITYNIDGGVTKKATMPATSPPYISLTTLDTFAPGKHTLNILVTMLKQTAEINSIASLQPQLDQQITAKVIFRLEDELPPAVSTVPPAAATADKEQPAAATADKEQPAAATADKEQPAAATADKEQPAAAASPVPAGEVPTAPTPSAAAPPAPANSTAAPAPAGDTTAQPALPGDVGPSIDATISQQATKYYCMRQYNVGGRIHSSKSVAAGDSGVMECAVACNALGSGCSGFGLTGRKCFLMKSFNTNSSAPDATMDALCMKNPADWLSLGTRNAEDVGSGFYCLKGYDLKGDPAGTGDVDSPVKAAVTELTGVTPTTCATACKGTAGCQYFLINKPATPGGTATCYLKMHALGGMYGTTGPKADVGLTCFNGQDGWMTFAGQLDYTVPSPEVNTGVATPSVASIASALGGIGNDTSSKTYRCIKQYTIDGANLDKVQVSLGDEGLTQCAQKCDDQQGRCIAFTMSETGLCNLFSSVSFNASDADPRMYGLCFASSLDWNKFGNPDSSSMYCIKHYDFAGDGVRMVDYITITSGQAAVQFCKQQCLAEPQCQYVVTTLGKCYMKNNILSGNFGTTRPDTAVDASCVKGEQSWGLAALQVSAAPPKPVGPGTANLTARRSVALQQNAAGESCKVFSSSLVLATLLTGMLLLGVEQL